MALERLDLGGALGDYLDGLVAPPAPLADLYRETAGEPGAQMMTHPDLGRLLAVLVRATGGRRLLEVGTFVGVSATWMAAALAPGGRLDTLEIDAARADRAEAWFRRAGIADRVTVHRGPAAEILRDLPDGAYDLCYIDADKVSYPTYLEHAVRLVRSGGLILADNVLAGGSVADPAPDDERAQAVREFTAAAMADPRLDTTVLTIGDGVTLSAVR